MKKTGILLVNLGTPDSPRIGDVHRYLVEFLTDPRVIDKPWLIRQTLVRGCIIPSRLKQSSLSYQAIWTAEGSPLKVYGLRVKAALQQVLGDHYLVELGMRYREPPIEQALHHLMEGGVHRIVILPMFPQYASATTGSVHQKVMEIASKFTVIPELVFISQYATHPSFIEAFRGIASQHSLNEYDQIVFSFHGLPQSQIMEADRNGKCLKAPGCCSSASACDQDCYSAQCFATARALAQSLHLSTGRYSIVFQSRLGKDPWLQPYFSQELEALAHREHKKVLVFCPSFVCDCLETIYEIGVEYAAEFKRAGGHRLDLVAGLNDHPAWIQAIAAIVKERLGSLVDNVQTAS